MWGKKKYGTWKLGHVNSISINAMYITNAFSGVPGGLGKQKLFRCLNSCIREPLPSSFRAICSHESEAEEMPPLAAVIGSDNKGTGHFTRASLKNTQLSSFPLQGTPLNAFSLLLTPLSCMLRTTLIPSVTVSHQVLTWLIF